MFWLSIHKVRGESMSPRIPDKSYALILSTRMAHRLGFMLPKVGDTLVVDHDRLGTIIKTVAKIDRLGRFWLKRENDSSVSMREMGPIRLRQVIGKVVFNIKENGSSGITVGKNEQILR
ncbi:S24 family peptidase [Endozoicomonas numazuensis]|uniref:S24 family peptidase n=1 Tax=Endozoicomonas numazuensis TaxID=1137799 RepID=UPI000689A1C9|nr:S24 family peptidase [Endozoicomonas numazuensis]